ncbi:MAG: beta-CASP ribonuclease aCPSF1 [Candidatus Thermoplasmatota archaeon]|nr:beta-CASP ribonuclease aCPSF1 [Euryarchaeota archaeon]MBU4032885.1 beta-CASP ribonuclease aCPSF1 [Candidatus Thermoplasmatota archaeon]MBU4070642.1 beta-CASP ribonuclease aCPSF1 [Candidatus Thermoplasmatota archaeon]MBU4145137.1 beta-CASP ribonuclease aCPSF1 [Candidatus Thermoplasmatota archaeon]MBU4591587.1 beta-CASP ribonuclease aCPSF1 [Candidatus Thermoplasmatota archaeon]
MSIEQILEQARDEIRRIVPPNIKITEIDFEGAVIIIYTEDMEGLANNIEIIKQLAQSLRRRVAIRPDPKLLSNAEQAEAEIRKIIPEEAEITDIYFEHETGEVTIEAITPGLVIGKHGALLNELKKTIGWAPKVTRAPPLPSKTVSEVRSYLRSVREDRIEFLRKLGRRLVRETPEGENWVRLTTLGGYREVGRSCTLLHTKNSKVMIDCGAMPSSDNVTPYLMAPELLPIESLDAVVITHAHLDHCGMLPVLYKYGYTGPVYCTPPTRDLMSLLLIDSIKVSFGEAKKGQYESSHVREIVKHSIPLKYGETTDIAHDVRLTFQNSGHILGSAVCHFHIGDGLYNIAMTGDMKFEKSWLFNAAVNRFPRVETLVMESTYGGYHDMQPSRTEASVQLRQTLVRTLELGGRVLVPVFAVGRSQEVMLVLEDLMRNEQIPSVPVYLDGMIWEATAIHTAYPEYLNSSLRTQIFQQKENPFLSPIFKRVESMDMRQRIADDPEPCIVLATAGMMNGGPVLEYLKAWARDPKSSIIFVGYQAEGTMGRKIQKGWKEIQLSNRSDGMVLDMNMNVETVDGFSGHSDRRQLMRYVEGMEPKPERIIIGHGEDYKCSDLASSMYKKFGFETRAPMNLETIRVK